MVVAAFVAPYLLEATSRFVLSAARLPDVHANLDAARADVLAFTKFPRNLWRQILVQQSHIR